MRSVLKTGYDIPKELSVCFTGHRPEKLPWGRYEYDPRCEGFKKKLDAEIIRAYREGARYFLSGMADGVDLYAAEAVLKLSVLLPEIKLVAVFPYGTGDTARKRRIAERAFAVLSLHDEYVRTCFMERNRFLVEHASRIICGTSGTNIGGTAATMRIAREAGLDIVILNIG